MSRGLTTLESRLGVRLVTRTSRSLELTEEGQLFYERCARIVADIADAEAEASSKGATIKGMVRIGGPMELGGDWSLHSLQSSEESFPMSRFTLCCLIPAWM